MSDILVTPPQLRQKADHVRESGKNIQKSVDEVDRIIQSLGPFRFEGLSADTIRRRYRAVRPLVYKFRPLLVAFAGKLDEIAGRFKAADEKMG
jgi:WXG100 family type VII secretion target